MGGNVKDVMIAKMLKYVKGKTSNEFTVLC